MNKLLLCAVPLTVSACGERQVDSGTAVGNPGNLTLGSDLPTEGRITLAEATVTELLPRSCDDLEPLPVTVDASFDLLEPGAMTVPLPAERYCELEVRFDPLQPVYVEGQTATGTDFTAVLPVADLRFDLDVTVDGNELLLLLPLAQYLPSEAIDSRGPDAELPRDDPDAETWAEGVSSRSELQIDGEVASPSPSGELSAGCGCAGSPGNPAGWTALLALLAYRRRRYQGS